MLIDSGQSCFVFRFSFYFSCQSIFIVITLNRIRFGFLGNCFIIFHLSHGSMVLQ